MGKFEGLVALITGASAGIGLALAREMAREGANLVLLARRIERLKAIAGEIDPSGQGVLPIACDVTKDEDLERATKLAQGQFGQIDIVIANAGWAVRGNFEDLNVNDYQRQWETNVFGVLRTIYRTLEPLKKSRGRLVIIGSVKSYLSLAGDSPYAMSKFALRALSESLSQELAPYGVSVSLICPGYVATELRQIDNNGIFHSDWQDPIAPGMVVSAQKAARQMLRAIYRRQPEMVMTNYGRLAVLLKRYIPGLLSWLISILKIRVDSNVDKRS